MEDSVKDLIKTHRDEILPTSRLEDFVIGMVDKVTEIKENYANIQINVDYNDVYEAIENAKDDFIRLLCEEECFMFNDVKAEIIIDCIENYGDLEQLLRLTDGSFPKTFSSWCLLQMIEHINCWIEL